MTDPTMSDWIRSRAGRSLVAPINSEVRRLAERLEAAGSSPGKSEAEAAELLGTEAPPPTDFGGGARGRAAFGRRDFNDELRDAASRRTWTGPIDL